mgnify:CR=1 FL=1
MKILAIGDTADNIFTLKKFAKKSAIHLITFPRKQDALFTNLDGDTEFFDSLLITKQVKKMSTFTGCTVNFKDRKSTRLNSSHTDISRMPSSA